MLAGFAYEKIIPEKILSSVNGNTLGGMLQLPNSVQAKEDVDSKNLFDGIRTFLEKYQSIGTDAAKALALQHILDLQPVVLKDFTDFIATQNISQIFAPNTNPTSLIASFGQNASSMSFEQIQK